MGILLNGEAMKISYNKRLIILIILMAIISVFSIQSASILLGENNLMYKQIVWYIIGFLSMFLISKINNKTIYKNIWKLYIIGNIFLLLLLIFGKPINNSKCWFSIFNITIQPSEFMKVILIIIIGVTISKFNRNYRKHTTKDEVLFLLKVFGIVLIPSLLTFLEPDTGAVIIYLVIMVTMLFLSGIKYRWFTIVISIVAAILIFICVMYKYDIDLFIDTFGSSLLLRMDRLFEWLAKDGYQLNHSLAAIGSASLFGFGFNHTPIYFPEADTDFIFAVFSSNSGIVGSIMLILIITLFDITLIKKGMCVRDAIDKYIISGTIGMLLYGQVQNIGMTYGVLPITGITLPFISYGGSSLISYLILVGLIINMKEKNS